ncbi:MAG: rRNA maturation RNAse YbeY [Desulfovibrio sp.]
MVILRLVDDQTIALYNGCYMGLNGPTNILSFPSDEFPLGALPADPAHLFNIDKEDEGGPEVFDVGLINSEFYHDDGAGSDDLGPEVDMDLLESMDFEDVDKLEADFCEPCEVLASDNLTDDGLVFRGELVLSVNTLERETFLYSQRPAEHLSRLLAHGLLHLAGYDHGVEMDALTDKAVDAASGLFHTSA